MMTVLISSHGAAWTFYAAAGDKVFLVETVHPEDAMTGEAMAYLMREARWLFGDRRLVYLNRDGKWMEVIHDGTGLIKGFEPYDGPVPQQEQDHDNV